MNTQEELRQRYNRLYKHMSESDNVEHMMTFGKVMNEIMEWMIANKPEAASDWIDQLDSVMWNNYITYKEADAIVSKMDPKSPWSPEQWKSAMQQHGYPLEEPPYYNKYALYVVMSMEYSDSLTTITKYMKDGDLFEVIHAFALNKLKDKDKVFNVRKYFNLK